MVAFDMARTALCAVAIVVINVCVVTSMRVMGPACKGFNGTLKYEPGKAYYYDYESNFGGFIYNGMTNFGPNPTLKVKATVVFTFISECDVVLNIEDVKVTAGSTGSTETTFIRMPNKSYMKFFFNQGLVEHVFVDPAEAAWTQNLKRGILSMVQNGAAFTFDLDAHESSVYGVCPTTYDFSGGKIINLTRCSNGESSDLIFQGTPYHAPHVENKLIFGVIRPAQLAKCFQKLDNGILSKAACKEYGSGMFEVVGMNATLKYLRSEAKTVNSADLAHLTLPASILYNFTESFSKNSTAENQITELLKTLETEGSNKAEVFIQLKKFIRRAGNLEQFEKSDLLKEEIHSKTFYDAMAEVATDAAISALAKLTKNGAVDQITQLKFFGTIAFATNPGPRALSAMSSLVKNIPNVIGPLPQDGNQTEEFQSRLTTVQHLLLGASGLAYQFCKNFPTCLRRTEYVDLVDAISEQLNIKQILDSKKVAGAEEIALATLQALGNLARLTPKAVKKLQEIFSADQKKVPDWLLIQGLEAFRRDACVGELKKIERGILSDVKHSEQVKIVAYLTMSRCLIGEDTATIHLVLKTNSQVSRFIATHVRSIIGSSSPSFYILKNSLSHIDVPEKIASVEKFSRASQFVEYSAFNEKENFGASGSATILFHEQENKPQFVSFSATLDLFGRSFNFLELGLSQRMLDKDMRSSPYGGTWCCYDAAAGAKDSYIRVFGTTVALGLESLHEAVQTTLLKMMKGGSATWKLNAILPTTLLAEEITFPSLMGMPLTFDLAAVEFDMAKLELTPGKKDMAELMGTLFEPPFDYKMKADCFLSLAGQAGLGIGVNTPMAVGHRVEGKLTQRSTFDLELTSNDKTLVDLKLTFPRGVIDTRVLEAEWFGYQEVNEIFERLSEPDDPHRNIIFLGTTFTDCRDCELTGLRGCKSWHTGDGKVLYKSTLEKTEMNMKGFEVSVTSDNKGGYKASLTTPGSTTSRHLTLGISFQDEPQKIKVEVEGQLDRSTHRGQLNFEYRPSKVASTVLPGDYEVVAKLSTQGKETKVAKAKLTQDVQNQIHMTWEVTGLLKGEANVTLERQHYHADIDVKMPVAGIEVMVTDDIRDSKDEYKHVTKQVITDMERSDRKVTTDSSIVFQKVQRSLQIDSSTVESRKTDKSVRILGKFHADAKIAQDFYNGRSSAAMTFQDTGGAIATASLNQTNQQQAETFKSDTDFDLVPIGSPKFTYRSKVNYDRQNHVPAKYDFQYQLSVENEFKGTFFVPFDIVVIDNYELHKEKDKQVYIGELRSNITDERRLVRSAELTVRWSDEGRNKHVTKMQGSSTNGVVRDILSATVVQMHPSLNLRTTNITADIYRTNVTHPSTPQHIFTESVNQSLLINSLMDFKWNDDGYVKYLEENEINWCGELKVHEKAFRLFEEIKEKHGNVTVDTKFILDISAQLFEETYNPKFGVKAVHNTLANAKAVNITLSR